MLAAMYTIKPIIISATEPKFTKLMLFQPKKWLRIMRIAPMMKAAIPAIFRLLAIIYVVFSYFASAKKHIII